eukprot:10097640-Prorocentrum_lima.AAC.1
MAVLVQVAKEVQAACKRPRCQRRIGSDADSESRADGGRAEGFAWLDVEASGSAPRQFPWLALLRVA